MNIKLYARWSFTNKVRRDYYKSSFIDFCEQTINDHINDAANVCLSVSSSAAATSIVILNVDHVQQLISDFIAINIPPSGNVTHTIVTVKCYAVTSTLTVIDLIITDCGTTYNFAKTLTWDIKEAQPSPSLNDIQWYQYDT